MPILLISSSLNEDSKSRAMLRLAETKLKELGASIDWIDLQEHPLPLAGSSESWESPEAEKLSKRIEAADAILIGIPVYNYDVNAALKNLVELTGGAWEGKLLGFYCAAGGHASYMSVMAFANSMMLDFRCLIIPRFVYSIHAEWQGMNLKEAKTQKRIEELAQECLRLAKALKK
jgi:FMN reductase